MCSIALLVDDKNIKRQLKSLLASTHTLMRGRSANFLPKRAFDLAIVDLPALERLHSQLQSLRSELIPVYLPILLIISEQELADDFFLAVRNDIDDILLTPVIQGEIEIRLRNLLHLKQQSLETERRYMALTETSFAGVIIIQGRRVVYVNHALADMCGYRKNEFEKLSPFQFRLMVHPDDRRRILGRMFDVLRGKGPSFHTDFRFERKDRTLRWVEMMVSRIKYHGLPALLGTTIDITEQVQTRQALRQSEELLRKSIDSELVAIAICGQNDGVFLEANSGFLTMTGYPREQVIGRSVSELDLFSPDDWEELIKAVVQDGRIQNQELNFSTKFGEPRTALYSIGRITLRDEPSLLVTMVDVTKRNRALEELRQRESALKQAQTVSHVGSWAWHIQTNELEWSDEMYHIFGISKDTFSGDLTDVIQQAIHPDDREAVNASNLSVIEKKSPIPLEYRIIRPDGTVRIVWAEAGELILDEAGQPIILTGIVQDITERKQVEEALRQSQERIQSLYDSMMEGLGLHELVYDDAGEVCDYRILDVNPQFEEILGYKRENVVGKLATEAYGMKKPPYLDIYARVAKGGGPYQFETYYKPLDRYFRISVFSPAEDQFATTFTDITESNRMEEALRHSEERYRLLTETTPDLIIVHDTEGRITYVNQACLDSLGFDQGELIGKKTSVLISAEYLPEVADRRERRMGGDLGTLHYEIELQRQDGACLPFDVSSTPIIQDGEVRGILVVARDMTARKQAEEALRQSEQRYRLLAETTPDLIILQDMEGLINYINQAGLQFTGYEWEEIENKPVTDFVPEIYVDPIMQMRAKRRKGDRQPYHFELEFINKTGMRIPVDVRTTPIIQGDVVSHILIVARDITGRKRSEEALRRSQSLLNKSQAIAQVGSWELDLTENHLMWSDEVYRIFGLDPQTFDATYEGFMACVHPDDRQAVDQAYYRSLEVGGDPYEIEHRIIRQDTGEIRIVFEKGEHLKDTAGQVVRSIGMVQDITERKRAEQAFMASEQKFREVVKQATDGIVLADSRGTIVEWNQRLADITGIPRENVIGLPIWQVQSQMAAPESRSEDLEQNLQGFISQIIEERKSEAFGRAIEQNIMRPDGTTRTVESALFPISFADEFMLGSVIRDMSERKQAEEERERLTEQIRDQASQMEQILETVPAGVALLDGRGIIMQANPVAEKVLFSLAKAKVGDQLTRLGSRTLPEILSPPPNGLWHEISNNKQIFELIARPMDNGSGTGFWVLVINDVTREREIRAQLQQQGQLAVVGQLAAGIAHDFNNIIAIIGLYAELGLNSPDLDPRLEERFDMIAQQADRAARLTEQMMDFSRSSVIERHPMDLTQLINDFGKLLEQTLPENIELVLDNQSRVCTVNADATRLQQAFLNLALNARDAMLVKGGGRLAITMSEPELVDEIRCVTCGQISGGDWIRIEIRDNGTGIDPSVQSHIFEPFFTTKDIGQGTGLGLAQVYGIIKQHDGHIYVESELGIGTTFSIYLPLLPITLESFERKHATGRVLGNGERVLVVEDNEVLRNALRETLELLNYRIVEAENGREALTLLETEADIDVVLTDMVMPEMGGMEMFREIQKQQPTMPVVMLSGHPMESEMARLKLEGLAGWLLKPPSPDKLAQMIAGVFTNQTD